MLDLIAGRLATQQARELARSALPDAPVRRQPERAAARPLRRRTALALHRLADRLEPAPSPSTAAR
jgi:hypothetical protein